MTTHRHRTQRGFVGVITAALLGSLSWAAVPSVAVTGDDDRGSRHVPATELSKGELAAERCVVPAYADDAVLRILKSVADSRQVSSKVRLAMFETAWVESHANSLPCGDSDSAGVFQQRPSMGWGTLTQVQDPAYAAAKFLDGNGGAGAIRIAAANPSLTAGQIAQKVQRSAYPSRYDQAASTANALITRSNQIASGAIPAGSYRWPDVQKGEKNNRVTAIQLLLRARGYSLTVDGSFGPATDTAVRNFQTKSGLGSDGVVGPNTWGRLIQNLGSGSSGDAVRAVQRLLQVHGYSLSADGSYGPITRDAVSRFRAGHKLPAGTTTDAKVWNTLIAIKR